MVRGRLRCSGELARSRQEKAQNVFFDGSTREHYSLNMHLLAGARTKFHLYEIYSCLAFCSVWHLGGFGNMENTPMGCGSGSLIILRTCKSHSESTQHNQNRFFMF